MLREQLFIALATVTTWSGLAGMQPSTSSDENTPASVGQPRCLFTECDACTQDCKSSMTAYARNRIVAWHATSGRARHETAGTGLCPTRQAVCPCDAVRRGVRRRARLQQWQVHDGTPGSLSRQPHFCGKGAASTASLAVPSAATAALQAASVATAAPQAAFSEAAAPPPPKH